MGKANEVVVTRCPVGNSTEIALQNGWLAEAYEKAGVKLRYLNELDKEHWHKHFTQESPLSFREGGNIPPIWAQSRGIRTKLIGLTSLPQSHALVVRADSALKTIADLRGKKIGIAVHPNSKVDFFLAVEKRAWETALSAFGLTFKDVVPLEIRFENNYLHTEEKAASGYIFNHDADGLKFQQEEIDALKAGTVDAIYTYGGRVHVLENLGLARVLYNITEHPEVSQASNLYPNILTVDEAFAEENPELVELYISQLLRASTWAKTNRDGVIDIFSQGTFADKAAIAKSRPENFNNHLRPGFSEADIQALISQKDYLLRTGFIEKDFDVHAWLEPRYLETVIKNENL